MENERRNDTHQNIRVVLPPRPERKAKGKPEAVQGENQPVRVTIPPHPSRRTASPQQTMAPRLQYYAARGKRNCAAWRPRRA